MDGPDHAASLQPEELKLLVSGIRNIEKALKGSGKKEPSESERKNIIVGRKSIVAAENIFKGERFTIKNITSKRPGNGISPMRWGDVIGRIALRDFKKDEIIEI
jgi:N,N'-diacetyllegionaminate synthase